jgi:hypothetical protein
MMDANANYYGLIPWQTSRLLQGDLLKQTCENNVFIHQASALSGPSLVSLLLSIHRKMSDPSQLITFD